jgi:putative pyruvate formate lyase activating enzyme
MDAGLNVASVCIHKGEEPVISGTEGICNVFFAGCNLRCIYCQNHEISQPCKIKLSGGIDPENLLDRISEILSHGVSSVGFVSPSHMVHKVRAIIEGLNSRGLKPVTVYNTNSYDKPETLRSLEGLIDVYLPDYKYFTPELSAELSDAPDYPSVALKAIREMYYQKGSTLRLDENGKAENGMLIRHLVLPGYSEESKKVLRSIAEEVSTGVHISLMSQYHPAFLTTDHPNLGRLLYKAEYESVVEEMERLGFRNGYIQELDSNVNYRPDFRKENPFE